MALPGTAAGPVILYELNEVPWRVVDWYRRERPASHLTSLVEDAETYTSFTRDEGELHPWVTWPTLHRSVYNPVHRIRYINQDLSCAQNYPPLWEKLARAGKRVGVFGSLQSYPPPQGLSYAFYVPDTFAPGPETIPDRYSCFQRINLRQTQADRAVAKDVRVDKSIAGDLLALLGNGLKPKTVARLAAQLINEKRAGAHRTRRPILQAPLAFDVFRHALVKTEPDFCTFFTNHVAGIMHRYWKYAFPEDFAYQLTDATDLFHRESLLVALDHADEQIGFLKSYIDARQGRLYIASSMGQEAIQRQHEIELVIENTEQFVRSIGFDKRVTPLAAMHPDYSFGFDSNGDAREFARLVSALRRANGTPAFYGIDVQKHTVSCATGSGESLVPADGGAPYLTRAEDEAHLSFDRAGLTLIKRDVGTGYHQPEGMLIRYGKGIAENDSRERIESIRIAPMIMADLDVEDIYMPLSTAERRRVRAERVFA